MNRSNIISVMVALMLPVVVLKAQDRIVTVGGDTIYCRIASIGNERIVYEQPSANGEMTGRYIDVAQVSSYSRGDAHLPVVPVFVEERRKRRIARPERPWQFAIAGGGAWMPTVPIESSFPFSIVSTDINCDGLKHGVQVNASAHYMIFKFLGAGFRYVGFYSNASGTYNWNTGNGAVPVYSFAEKNHRQYLNFIGESVIFRQSPGRADKFHISETVSAGVILYRNETRAKLSGFAYNPDGTVNWAEMNSNELVRGWTLGVGIGVSAEYQMLPWLSAGLAGELVSGTLRRVKSIYKDADGYENKNTIGDLIIDVFYLDYSLFVRFSF